MESGLELSNQLDVFLEKSYFDQNSAVLKDLSANLKKYLLQGQLTTAEALLVLYSTGVSLRSLELSKFAEVELRRLEFNDPLMQEIREIVALMKMNNTYYKFRSCISDDKDFGTSEKYPRTGLRMQSLTQRLNQEKDTEIISLSVSILNSCSICVRAHERRMTEIGFTSEKIHDVARLTAISAGLAQLLQN